LLRTIGSLSLSLSLSHFSCYCYCTGIDNVWFKHCKIVYISSEPLGVLHHMFVILLSACGTLRCKLPGDLDFVPVVDFFFEP
jgi:hypothetical protein